MTATQPITRFPADFLWGTATAAYQIEGAITEGERGASVWDTFTHQPGVIERGENGDVASDHYHRWQTDVALMAQLGLRAYRFSLAWSRILPEGAGRVNTTGLDFYDTLVDALLERNITPFITLYHWDLPQALQDKGGWLNRDTASRMMDYADIVTRRLGDRVRHWITLNEPFINMEYGYVVGTHAPGLIGAQHALPVMHHLLLGHGLALQAIRANVKDAQAGIAYSLAKIEPATDRDDDVEVVARADAYINTSSLDPVLRGEYPPQLKDLIPDELIHDSDMRIIGAPTDLIGVNYYLRLLVRAAPKLPAGFEVVPPRAKELTAMGWEVYPQGLADWLRRVAADYPDHAIYITENGAAYPDTLEPNGVVHDPQRIDYLRQHVQVALSALAAGVPLKGYFIWSLLDNFEWAFGFRPRFGLIYVDYATQQRYIKDSGRWLAQLIATGAPDEA